MWLFYYCLIRLMILSCLMARLLDLRSDWFLPLFCTSFVLPVTMCLVSWIPRIPIFCRPGQSHHFSRGSTHLDETCSSIEPNQGFGTLVHSQEPVSITFKIRCILKEFCQRKRFVPSRKVRFSVCVYPFTCKGGYTPFGGSWDPTFEFELKLTGKDSSDPTQHEWGIHL